MREKVEDYIWKQNIIPKKICRKTIKEIEKVKWNKHRWYSQHNDKVEDLKHNQELQVYPGTLAQQNTFAPYLIKALKEYQRIFSVYGGNTGVNWLNNLNRLRFNKYENGAKMLKHYDHIHDVFDGKKKGVPLISLIIQLNGGYEGAELYLRDKETPLKTGDVLFFPSNFMYPHEVKEIKKGVRYSIVCWSW